MNKEDVEEVGEIFTVSTFTFFVLNTVIFSQLFKLQKKGKFHFYFNPPFL